MHPDEFIGQKAFYLLPSENLIPRKLPFIVSNIALMLPDIFIDIVGKEKINLIAIINMFFDAGKVFFISLIIDPVIRIYDFQIDTLSLFDANIDTGTMSAVLFVNSTDNSRILLPIFVCNLIGSIRRTIIDN